MKIKAIISDLHFHNWNQFSSVTSEGVNTRLQILIDEVIRAAEVLRREGGTTLLVAGDVFHVRGTITPTVFNPVQKTFKGIVKSGIKIVIIPGNHDLEGKDSRSVSSSITSLIEVGCIVHSTSHLDLDDKVLMVPWHENVSELREVLVKLSKEHAAIKSDIDVVIHAPVDDVIIGIPGHGLTADWLADLGFKRVFCGHYHNHKNFNDKVYSIGAIAHHTWSDPDSKAGFLLVEDTCVRYQATNAPKFVDVDSSMDETDIEFAVDGNYARAKINKSTTKDVENLREFLEKAGAKGVVINAVKEPTRVRASTVKSGATMETSLSEFVKNSKKIGDEMKSKVSLIAMEILAGVD
jgi:DNA repair exonuclease SbcCD nuclease subunit